MAGLPEVLPKTGALVELDMITADPAIVRDRADETLQELQAAMLLTNPDADNSKSTLVQRYFPGRS
jgi:hypothetical protein